MMYGSSRAILAGSTESHSASWSSVNFHLGSVSRNGEDRRRDLSDRRGSNVNVL